MIMAGGSGTRLWPLSRKGEPKQLLRMIDGHSLLRLAFERIAGAIDPSRILICTGAAYLDEVAAQLPEIPPENLLGEPIGRDSLNAVAWPAAVLAARDPEAVTAVITADQIIEPVEEFRDRLETAFQVAERDHDALVTFGIVPTEPNTGYGYLHRGLDVPGFADVSEVTEFKEKPDETTAEAYLSSGRYWWNSGMFVWRVATLLHQVELLLPETHRAVLELAAHPEKLGEIYPELFKSSVDYGVMEPVSQGRGSAHVVAVALGTRWADVGSFASLHAELPHDEQGNVVQGPVVAENTRDCLLINTDSSGSVLAVAGLQGMVVIRTDSATMTCALADSQMVKTLVGRVAHEVDAELA